MAVLLYTYFYISLNLLKPAFLNINNLPFLRFPHIGKIRVKVGQKLVTFPTLWAPAPTKLQFSIFFLTDM